MKHINLSSIINYVMYEQQETTIKYRVLLSFIFHQLPDHFELITKLQGDTYIIQYMCVVLLPCTLCRRRPTCGQLICIGLRVYFNSALPASNLFTCQCCERPAGRQGEALDKLNAERRDGNDKHYSLTRAVARILFLGKGAQCYAI